MPDELGTAHPEIPCRDIAAIGNILRHGYDSLNHDIVWGVIESDPPPLKLDVESMLRELGPLDSDPT